MSNKLGRGIQTEINYLQSHLRGGLQINLRQNLTGNLVDYIWGELYVTLFQIPHLTLQVPLEDDITTRRKNAQTR